jgi:hypothetical protein
MADNNLAALLANAADTKADFNFGRLNKSYWEGLDEAYKRRTQDAFQQGVPRDANGDVNWPAVSATLLEKGGVGAATPSIEGGKLTVQEGIRQQIRKNAIKAFSENPDEETPTAPPRSVSPSLASSGAQPTEGRPVPANDPTMTIPPRQVAAANAPPPPQQTQLPAPPPVPPYVPRPVQTVPQPLQPAPQMPPPQVAPPQASVSQAAPNYVVADRFAGTLPATAGAATDPTLGGLVPKGRPVDAHLRMLTQLAADNAASGVRDAAKPYLDRIDAIQKAIGQYRESGLKERQSIVEPAVKVAIDRVGESQKKADAIADGIVVSHDLLAQLDTKSGIFSGQWANQKLTLAKIGQAVNLNIAPEQITNTEAFSALVGKKVAQTVKSFGSGTSITDGDRKYAAKMEAGDITLDDTSIRRILNITDKINRGIIDKHNKGVADLVRSRPELRDLAPNLTVDMPAQRLSRYNTPAELAAAIKAGTVKSGQTIINGDGNEMVIH